MKKSFIVFLVLILSLLFAVQTFAIPLWTAPQSGTPSRNHVEVNWGDGSASGDWEIGLRTGQGGFNPVSEGQFTWPNGQKVPFIFNFSPLTGTLSYTLGGVNTAYTYSEYAGKGVDEIHLVAKTGNNGSDDNWSCNITDLSSNGTSFPDMLSSKAQNGNGGQWVTGSFSGLYSGSGQDVTIQGNITFSWQGNDPVGDRMGAFFFLGAPYEPQHPPQITVLTPNGGENWTVRTLQTITWTSTQVKKVNIKYSPDDGINWKKIKDKVKASDGSYSWEVADIESSNCLVKIVDSKNSDVSDVSNAPFTISKPPEITVISPNGGENWTVGNTHNITWNSAGMNDVRIEYTTDGSNWTTIAGAALASSGSYSWTIPDTPSLNCKVRISGSGISDESDGVFIISPVPSVTVISPNGGENWTAGSVQMITWSSANVSNIKIEYTADGNNWTTIETSIGASASSYSWTIPDTPSTNCSIRISSTNDQGVSDTSDAAFSISPQPSVTVTAPNGGEFWTAGIQQNITWTITNVSAVRLEYTTDGNNWTTIEESAAAASGSYAWTIPDTPSANCLVRISGSNDLSISDVSDGIFTISSPPAVTVIAPNGGEFWTAGTQQNITWTSTNVSAVKLDYTTDGSSWTTIEESVAAASGSYAWTIPDTPSVNCKVRITSTADPVVSDTSEGTFIIVPAPEVTVTAPNGGEFWTAGTQQNITWTSTNVSAVKLEYTTDGSNWTTIAESVAASTGSYTWTIPDTPSVNCKVRITSTSDPGVSDVSEGPFVIVPAPAVTVTSPNGGENWTAGTQQNITWTSTNVSAVKLDYTTDGSSWTTIEESVTAASGSYTWTIPDTPSTTCSVRISSTDNPDVSDVSDSVFAIFSSPAVTVMSPNGGENWTAGTQHNITWTSTNVSAVKLEYTSDGNNWTTIEESIVAASGSYTWTAPDIESSNCLVKITDTANPNVTDQSDGVFTITFAPTITVTVPNGGENWTAGTQHNITWTSTNVSAVKLEYTSDGNNWTTIEESVAAASGSYAWTVPDIESTDCLVKITDTANQNVTDRSDGVFTITFSPTITVTAPNGGENWTARTQHNITWTSTNVVAVKLEYTSDGNNWTTIEESGVAAASGSYAWTVPDIESSNCLVKITDTGNSNVTDWSDGVFTITFAPTITVTTPNGGEFWTAGTQQNITWSSTNVIAVKLEYTTNGSSWTTIGESVAAAYGSYTWTIPGTPSVNCKVRITSTADPGVSDMSEGTFVIVPAPAVTVTLPNGGENWTAGTQQNITWTSTNVSAVRIEFTPDGSIWTILAPSVPASPGSYTWNVPLIESSNCYVRIVDTANPGITDQSDGAFTITSAPSVTVISPNGGENWTVETVENITWTSSNVDKVKILYAKDSGPWITIVENISASPGSYPWTIVNEPSDHFLIRVEDMSDSNTADQSDTFFTVSPPAEANIVNIDTGAVYEKLAPAVNEVQAGETLEFRKSGIYKSEKIEINKNNVTLRVAPGLDVKLNANNNNYCLKISADGVNVSGVTVFDSRKYGIWITSKYVTLIDISTKNFISNDGIHAENADNLSITNLSLEDCGIAGLNISNSSHITVDGVITPQFHSCKDGIIIDQCGDVTLTNLTIGTDWQDNLRILGSTDVRISNSSFRKARNGIFIEHSSGITIESCNTEQAWNNSVYIFNSSNCVFDGGNINSVFFGIHLKETTDITIKNITVLGNILTSTGVFVEGGSQTTISTCTIGRMLSGITLTNSPDTYIDHTIIRNSVMGAFVGTNSHRTSLVNNTIVKNGSSGIYIKGAVENVTIRNNIIVNNGWVAWSWGIQCQNDNHPGLSITYNDVWNNREQYKNCSPGTGEISADPQFVANFSDVHLKEGSPCIDAGDPSDPVGEEPEDNGDRINQGAYGGTAEAQTSSSQILSVTEAAANGWMSLYCYTWDGIEYVKHSGIGGLNSFSAVSSVLPPWTGFWVYVERNLDILFPPDPRSGPNEMSLFIDPERYYLISCPLQPYDPDINAVFGDDLGDGNHDGSPIQIWRTSKYDHRTEQYTRYTGPGSLDTILAGRGYWMFHYFYDPMEITVSGTPVDQNSYTEFKLPARNGQGTFHMVGNPFHYNMNWSDVMVRVPMTESNPLGKIAAISMPASMDEIDTWHIDLEVSDPTGTYYDTDNRAGVVESGDDLSSALSSFDMFPFTEEYVRLVITDPYGFDDNRYSYDYHAPGANEYVWQIELTTSFSAIDVNFDLNNIDEVPSHYNLTLVDQFDSVTELTDDASIPITLSNTGAKTFLLTASRKDFVDVEETAPKPFSITGVFPNPFNPSTTLTFSMEREGKVRGRVFNLSGQVVDTIVEGSLSAGRHSVVWDASGHASGVYIIVLESRGMRDSRKVTLIK